MLRIKNFDPVSHQTVSVLNDRPSLSLYIYTYIQQPPVATAILLAEKVVCWLAQRVHIYISIYMHTYR